MGVRGAALASIWVQVATVVGLALYCARASGLRRYTLFQRFWRPGVWRPWWHGLGLGLALVWPGGRNRAVFRRGLAGRDVSVYN